MPTGSGRSLPPTGGSGSLQDAAPFFCTCEFPEILPIASFTLHNMGLLCDPVTPTMISSTGILTIDLTAIQSNWQYVFAKLRPGAQCAAVVKANAYG